MVFSRTHMSEGEPSFRTGEKRGKADRVAAVGAAVYSNEDVLEHVASSNGRAHDDR